MKTTTISLAAIWLIASADPARAIGCNSIGYWKPYATSHDDLDADEALQEEVRNAARTLVEGVKANRAGELVAAGQDLTAPRQK